MESTVLFRGLGIYINPSMFPPRPPVTPTVSAFQPTNHVTNNNHGVQDTRVAR
jgi:hypothetical protein